MYRQITRWCAGFLLLVLSHSLAAPHLNAQTAPVPTQVMVRALSQDAKVLQDPVGGARITIRDVQTGEILASGIQKGRSGDTELIMVRPRERGAVVYDTPETAGFLATLMLEQPTQVEIIAEGPLGYPQAVQRASKTMLLVPGKDILGEGVLLTIHGFIVSIQEPDAQPVAPGAVLSVRATAVMTCGCPTEPGGMWDSNKMEVVARLVQNGKAAAEAPMRYAGERSTYEASIPVPANASGTYTVEVLAMDAAQANFGMDRKEVQVAGQ